MTHAQTAVVPRPTLGFALEGLSGRDETLFKAIVRLLDHRTLQRWVYRPGSPDVRVVGDSRFGTDASATGDTVVAPDIDALPPLLLTLGAAVGGGAHRLSLPLRADALEAELNSLGVERVQACGLNAPAMNGNVVHMLRWPPVQLLGTPERVRLATLMVSRPVTLAWVQQRAGLPPAACAQFFAELHDAGVLASSAALAAASSPAAMQGAGGNDARMTPPATAAAPAISAGLISRIRSRLGLLVRTSMA